MHPLFKEFNEHIEQSDKDWCVEKVLSWLSNGEIDIATLYDQILRPALIGELCQKADESICIWKEHVRTSIIRTVIEASYTYVIRERNSSKGNAKGKKVIVVCPTEELHEIGARMIADYFTICGFDVTFVGANTPLSQVLAGINFTNPAYVAVSVTNHYNLVAARKLLQNMINLRKEKGFTFKIIVGGSAFDRNIGLPKELGADMHLDGLEDIRKLEGGVK